MNGAQALLKTLVDCGIDVFFSNPGTSEMHLVDAIGRSDKARTILCLFEGVVTGAADGYGRMAGKPAATLLHVGCGLSNGMANLHNAWKAHSPVVNLVGDHATYHQQFDTPLATDVPAIAQTCSDWVAVSKSADTLSADGADAVNAALEGAGKIATLIIPANHAWEETATNSKAAEQPVPLRVSDSVVAEVAGLLSNGRRTGLILGGRALQEDALNVAGRISSATRASLICETFPVRLQRGAGRVPVTRIPYFAEKGAAFLSEYEQLILVGGRLPVAFFAYPGKQSLLAPENCLIKSLASVDEDVFSALTGLADHLDAAGAHMVRQPAVVHDSPRGKLTAETIGRSISLLLPENAIITDEGITNSLPVYTMTEGAVPHDWLAITGGAIGIGLPLALGASVACPDRKVVALQADGSAMYTLQALWTMAREKTDVTAVVFNNRSYAILNMELARVGTGKPNDKTLSMLDLGNPDLNWVQMSEGMGVPASRVTTAEAFHLAFEEAIQSPGPRLIEAMVSQDLGSIFG